MFAIQCLQVFWREETNRGRFCFSGKKNNWSKQSSKHKVPLLLYLTLHKKNKRKLEKNKETIAVIIMIVDLSIVGTVYILHT